MKNIFSFGSISKYFQGLYKRVNKFLKEWEQDMVAVEKEREESTKMPLFTPCINCGGEFSVDRYLSTGPSFNQQDFFNFSSGSAIFAGFPGQDTTIKVCSTCRMPV